MSYTPINWQTGDTITAEKMNKMDNGWGVQSTQLFSESVTTTDQGGMNMGVLAYNTQITRSSITVSFDGVDYEMTATVNASPIGDVYIYGDLVEGVPDFTIYPFLISSQPNGANYIGTQSAGTYTVAISAGGIAVSDNFSNAVNQCVDISTMPMLCVSGVTTETAMETAQQGEKLLYFKYSNATYIITGVGYGSISFIPSNSSIVPAFIDGVFDIGEV